MMILRKLVLTVLILAAFVGLVRIGPYRAAATGDATVSRPATGPLAAPPSAGETVSRSVVSMEVEGLPVGMEELPVSCSAGPWDPQAEGLCRAGCQVLSRQARDDLSTVVWREGGLDPGPPRASVLHAALRHCPARGSGSLYHFWTSMDPRPGRPAAADGQTRGPRPVPMLLAAEPVAQLETSGWSIFIDRPRFDNVAVEQVALDYLERGWLAAPGAGNLAHSAAAETRVFTRGAELCIVTLATDSDADLLVSACHLRASEVPS